MNEPVPIERLQPSLLDRLMSDDPKGADGHEDRVWSGSKLRTALLRDLEFLLNTTAAHSREELHRTNYASRSIVNYGLPSLAGMFVFQRHPDTLANMIQKAIVAFEPRILRDSLDVRATTDESGTGEVSIEISCEYCPLPMAESLLVRAVLDMETGAIQVKGRSD